jgi:hypothetical protein
MKIMTAIKQCAEKGWKEAVEGNGEQWMGRVVCARDGVEVQVR